jgi:dephospho-CoA kinase
MNMKWIGLTGGLASGKSTAAQFLSQLGVTVIDADQLAKESLEPGKPAYQQVVQVFGPDFLLPDLQIDRRKLGQSIFSNKSLREKLESFIHPVVQTQVQELKIKYAKQGSSIAIYDIPLLYEKKLSSQFDGVLLISCSLQTQIDRMKSRNQWTDEEITSRLQSQMSLLDKEKLATWVIQNEDSLAMLQMRLAQWLEKLK